MRTLQFLPWLESAGIMHVTCPLFNDAMLLQKYQNASYTFSAVLSAYWVRVRSLLKKQQFDLVWIEKEALPWWPAWFERWLLNGVPYCLDFDDAIFHNYDQHKSAWVRCLYGMRIDKLISGARLVVAGNNYIAERAIAAGASWVEIIPTVIDLERYAVKDGYNCLEKLRIVWIGSPSSVRYLSLITKSLASLAQSHPFKFRVIGGISNLPGVDTELCPWSLKVEAADIAECDIGIMPLFDTPWEKGKCSYKLIQYMACGLPTVASPIGANLDVVVPNETGFFAQSENDWVEKIDFLLRDPDVRRRFGQSGRKRVESLYSLQQVAPKLVKYLKTAGGF